MCNIEGYVGIKQAAPILLEMMRKEEGFAGGYNTGIATLHNGKISFTKLVVIALPKSHSRKLTWKYRSWMQRSLPAVMPL